MKKTKSDINKRTGVLSNYPDLKVIGFEVTCKGVLRPSKNRAKN
jgi:hypothetical protein